MSDQINRNTMQVHTSVNTPDYPIATFLNISGKPLPKCDKKHWKIVGEEVVEMTIAEKAVIDYVPIPPGLTQEELAIKAADERRQNIQTDIRIIYPELSDEVQELRMILAEEFPDNIRAQEYNSKIEAILAKYPKV